MDAVIAEAKLLPRERLHLLQQRRNGPSARRFFAQLGLYLGSALGLILASEAWQIAIALAISCVVQFAWFGLLHESCHDTVFTLRPLNRLSGWVAALAQPMSPALMRAFHFEHHRHTHELARDPELARLPFMVRWPSPLMWLPTMTGLPLVMARFGWTLFAALVPTGLSLWTRVLPFVQPEARRRVAWEARLLVLIHASMITIGVLWLPGVAWIYAGMLGAHALLALYTTCEHRGLAEGGSILERTRSLETPAALRWLLWNMPYHAEHHGWPAVPWHALPALHREVEAHLVHVERPLWLHLHGGRERPPVQKRSAKTSSISRSREVSPTDSWIE